MSGWKHFVGCRRYYSMAFLVDFESVVFSGYLVAGVHASSSELSYFRCRSKVPSFLRNVLYRTQRSGDSGGVAFLEGVDAAVPDSPSELSSSELSYFRWRSKVPSFLRSVLYLTQRSGDLGGVEAGVVDSSYELSYSELSYFKWPSRAAISLRNAYFWKKIFEIQIKTLAWVCYINKLFDFFEKLMLKNF